MDEVARSIKPIEVTFKVPALQWLRLQWLAGRVERPVEAAALVALQGGLNALHVPGTVAGLLDSDGNLRVPEEGVEEGLQDGGT